MMLPHIPIDLTKCSGELTAQTRIGIRCHVCVPYPRRLDTSRGTVPTCVIWKIEGRTCRGRSEIVNDLRGLPTPNDTLVIPYIWFSAVRWSNPAWRTPWTLEITYSATLLLKALSDVMIGGGEVGIESGGRCACARRCPYL